MDDIQTQIMALIADHLAVPPAKVTLEARLVEDLNADSLDTLDLITTINDEYEVTFTPQEVARMETVADLIDAVKSKK